LFKETFLARFVRNKTSAKHIQKNNRN